MVSDIYEGQDNTSSSILAIARYRPAVRAMDRVSFLSSEGNVGVRGLSANFVTHVRVDSAQAGRSPRKRGNARCGRKGPGY